MYVNGVATARVNETEYSDGWIRTFRKSQIPVITTSERFLLTDYLKNDKYEEILIYLQHFRGVDEEIAGFLLRELIRGNLLNAKQELQQASQSERTQSKKIRS